MDMWTFVICLTYLIHGEGYDVVDEDDRLHDAEEDIDDGHDDPRGRGPRRKRWNDGGMFERERHLRGHQNHS